jgi:hypothetical protein
MELRIPFTEQIFIMESQNPFQTAYFYNGISDFPFKVHICIMKSQNLHGPHFVMPALAIFLGQWDLEIEQISFIQYVHTVQPEKN